MVKTVTISIWILTLNFTVVDSTYLTIKPILEFSSILLRIDGDLLLMRRREAAFARKENRKENTLFETDYLLGMFLMVIAWVESDLKLTLVVNS